MGDNTDDDVASNSATCATSTVTNSAWVPNDLEILRSGLYADAEIICQNGFSAKVHRNILASRSAWFKRAFSDADTEDGRCVIRMDETASKVKLILHFLYAGSIDLTDETVTGGRDIMTLGVELLRLGETLEAENMQQHGKDLLCSHLETILDRICHTGVTNEVKAARFAELVDEDAFPVMFCLAVENAFDSERPVVFAQRVLADFAFAARIHLFKNPHFVLFITQEEVPEFGNLVLASLITGDISGAFRDNATFNKWQDWKFFPRAPAPLQTGRRIPPLGSRALAMLDIRE